MEHRHAAHHPDERGSHKPLHGNSTFTIYFYPHKTNSQSGIKPTYLKKNIFGAYSMSLLGESSLLALDVLKTVKMSIHPSLVPPALGAEGSCLSQVKTFRNIAEVLD